MKYGFSSILIVFLLGPLWVWGQEEFLEGKPAWLDISTDVFKDKPAWLDIPLGDVGAGAPSANPLPGTPPAQAPQPAVPSGPVAPDGVTPAIVLPIERAPPEQMPPTPPIRRSGPSREELEAQALADVLAEAERASEEAETVLQETLAAEEEDPMADRRRILRRSLSTESFKRFWRSTGPVVEVFEPFFSTGTVRPFRDPSGKGRLPLKAVTHIHSVLSQSGVLELETLAESAVEGGIDVFIPTDHLVSSWEYGIWPLRHLIKRRVRHPSILESGVQNYLDRLEALALNFPSLVVVPGMEVAPFYRWSGSLRKGLILEDWHRHLLVIGLDRAKDIETIPVLGSKAGRQLEIILFWPFALALIGLLFRKAGFKSVAHGLFAVGAFGLLFSFPFTRPKYDPYGDSTPWAPYQAVINDVRAKGGLAVWAHLESPSFNKPKKVTRWVSIRTQAYPSAVRRVMNHHGFGVFLEGYKNIAQPDGAWDGALKQFARGSRSVAPWAFSELDYRRPGMNNTYIDTARMIVFAERRSPPAVVEALRTGQFYALRSDRNPALVLERWTLTNSTSTVGTGETLYGTRVPEAEIIVSHQDGISRNVEMVLIRDGEVLHRDRRPTPAGWRIKDVGRSSQSEQSFYRVMLKDEHRVRLVSNPIFVTLREARRRKTKPPSD